MEKEQKQQLQKEQENSSERQSESSSDESSEKSSERSSEKSWQKLTDEQLDRKFNKLCSIASKRGITYIVKKIESYDYMVKIVLFGDSAVGKTNILQMLHNQWFKENHTPTIGADFSLKKINIDGVKMKMQTWDTSGLQRFKKLNQSYLKEAAGVILVYSVNDRKTFQGFQNQIKMVIKPQYSQICKLIVGNKCDVPESERQVSYQEGKKLADQYGMKFIESSAKQNTNISQIFMTIGKDIKANRLNKKLEQDY